MKKKVGIILLVISVILIAVAFLFRTDLVNLLPENCQNVVKVKLGGSFVTGEDDIEIHKEVDNEEYEEKNISHDGKSIALEHAATGNFSHYRGGIIGVTETEIAFYNVKGEKKWAEPIQISMPVLRGDGNFVLVFEKEGKRFSVYNGEKKLFSKTIDGVIKNGTISDNGDAVIVFEKEGYKGSVLVYNKSGEEVYLWNSGKYGVLDADISKSRKLAVSLLDTEKTVSSKIYFFDMGKTDVDESVDLENSIAFDIVFNEDMLEVYTDNKIFGVSTRGKIKWDYDLKNKKLAKYAMSEGGTKAVVFDKDNASEVSLISSAGKEKKTIKTDVLPDIVDIMNERILYNDGRTLIMTSLSGELLARHTCSRDIKDAYLIDKNNVFIVYNSSLEFLSMRGE